MTTLDGAAIWGIAIAAGAGTLALRFSLIGLIGKDVQLHPVLVRALRLVPAAVLAALVAPALARAPGGVDLFNARLAAGAVAALVAWRTRNVLATLGAGMVVLWVLQALA